MRYRNRLIALLTIALSIGFSGCSFVTTELNNRGGFIDAKLDEKWIIADTKPMRVLRAYVLLGSITRMAETKYKSEREIIVRHVNTALTVASDAYHCAYSQPGRCIYFDERMVEFEVAVLRLLVAVLTDRDDEELFEAIGKQLSKTFPLLKAVDGLTGFVQAITTGGEVAANVGKAIQAFLKVGQAVYFKGRRFGALYRDSIELTMIATLTSLDTMCAIQTQRFSTYDPVRHDWSTARVVDPVGRIYENTPARVRPGVTRTYNGTAVSSGLLDDNRLWAIENFYGLPHEMPAGACNSFKTGLALWHKGAGDFSTWVAWLSHDASNYRKWIIPSAEAFVQASDLVWRACEHLTSSKSELGECLGFRHESAEQNNLKPSSCALDFATEKSSADSKDAARKPIYLSTCRLILYPLVVDMRADRWDHRGPDARLAWLSHLTPRPSFPLARHPGQAN